LAEGQSAYPVPSIIKSEHIYSNGFICMSILYDEWSAALTVASICMSLISMLTSAAKKVYKK